MIEYRLDQYDEDYWVMIVRDQGHTVWSVISPHFTTEEEAHEYASKRGYVQV